MKKNSKKAADIVICILCLFLSLSFFSLLIFGTHEDFSERENKALQKFPKLNFNTIANGSFFSKLSDFSADQFPTRSLFCSVSSLSDLAIARNECNGVIVAKDGQLIARPEKTDCKTLANNLDAISTFFEKNQDTPSFLLVAPRAIDIASDKLPNLFFEDYGKYEYELLQKTIPYDKLINTKDKLKKLSRDGQQVWYKTDHHWTTRGAYEAYLMLCERLGETAYPLEYFDIECVTNVFWGTSFSKSGLPMISLSADTIEVFRYIADKSIKVTRPSTKNTVLGFYDMSALDKKDKYQIFLGGNSNYLQIRDAEKSKPRILLIKDSFANSLIPFLALHYDIDVIDLRYYKSSLKILIENNHFDKILFVYGIDTLVSEVSCSNITK